MKRVIIAITIATLSTAQAADYEMLTRAISKLIDENRQMRSEIALLKGEAERLRQLELEVKRMQAQRAEPADVNRTETGEQAVQPPEKKNFPEPFRPCRAVVTADRLNVRGGPGPQHGIFDALHKGSEVTIVEKAPGGWNRISWGDNNLGWVFSRWLEPLTKEGEKE
jgi:uncharacterized protein YgiM (DUF1202 family)